MTLIITPWINLDPVNLPKFLVLVVCAFALLGNLVLNVKKITARSEKMLLTFVMIFIVGLLLSFFSSETGYFEQIYGSFGRNTGLLAYVSLSIMLLGALFVSNPDFIRKLITVLIATGFINAVYGLVQWADFDPVDWNNSYNTILGTLGNPNFISALLGMAGLASLALLLSGKESLMVRVVLFLNIGLSLFVIFKSDSSQGLMIFALGSTVILYFKFVNGFKGSLVKYLYWCLVSGLGLMGIFGTLNKGPLAYFLFQDSVTYRGDYWRAGAKMTFDNPLFGVGLDSYGDWYRFSRTEAASLRRGPDVTSNSAHNVFLDISSNGGIFLLVAYLSIIAMVIRSTVRVLCKPGEFDAVGVGLSSAWLAYLVQSAISINQLGLAIWGWVLGGAIIGYDLNKDRTHSRRAKSKTDKRREQTAPSIALLGISSLLFGFMISIWPVTKDISFRRALESADALKIESATERFPRSAYYYTYAARIFQANDFDEKALVMAKKAIEANPRDFNAWKLLAANPKISQAERDLAIAKMKKLDPFNGSLGK